MNAHRPATLRGMSRAIHLKAPGSMLSELRSATRERHAALDEANFALRPENITRAHYIAFLRCMLAVVRPLEERMQALPLFEARMPDSQLRRRAAALTRDLHAVGAPDLPRDDAPHLPAIATVSQAFGCGYVLEGSSLGGAVLARALGPLLALAADSGMTYWTAYGDQVGPMWLRFIDALESWASRVSASERQVVTATASATFDTFIRQVTARSLASPEGTA